MNSLFNFQDKEEEKSPSRHFLDKMVSFGPKLAVYWNNQTYSYDEFLKLINSWLVKLDQDGIQEGTVCAIYGDFSPQVCSLIFALIKKKAIIVPLTSDVTTEMDHLMSVAGAEYIYRFNNNDESILEKLQQSAVPELVENFKHKKHAGLIVFTSGSTGKPKGILHDCELVMQKFLKPRSSWRTILFLLMDHFGGFNTFLSSFAYGGTAVCLSDRSPEGVVKTIEQSRANLLPTTPTFLNLMIAGRFFQNHDLSSIELITYGTEMMTPATLKAAAEIFPKATLKQTYGMSELGVLHSKSEDKNSLWVKVGGNGFETKVVDGILWIKSESNMIGYLNAPNPFDEQGWLCTGDEVEQQGEFIKFKGRKSEIINVGGKKVFPSEVENVILNASNIKDVTVFAKNHPLMGQVVHARITTIEPEESMPLTERLRKHCNEHLAKYKVPVRFIFTSLDESHHNARFKKDRLKSDV